MKTFSRRTKSYQIQKEFGITSGIKVQGKVRTPLIFKIGRDLELIKENKVHLMSLVRLMHQSIYK